MNNQVLSVIIYIEDKENNSIGMIDKSIDISTKTIDVGYDHEWGYRSILVDVITTSSSEIIDEIMELIEFEDNITVTDEMMKSIKKQLDKKIHPDDINLDDGIQFNIVI